jgi:tRNA-splicing ligase RtcB (3'-phosphate/5'-hydroxy nucleic acid ligase)
MLGKHNFVRVAENIWEIPPTFRDDMRVPARVYADEDLLDAALGDNSVVQLVNTATLPGVIKHAIAMPDIHQGYGFPIGGVVATRLPQGVISPGGVGYDINCGVRLLVSQVAVEEIKPFLQEIASALYANCPSGVGSHGCLRLNNTEMDGVLHRVRAGRWIKDTRLAKTWIAPRNSVGFRAPMLPMSQTALVNVGGINSGRWALETTLSR